MNNKICCFFGHRKIEYSDELEQSLYKILEHLITKENVHTFLFGSKSQFDDLCYKVITKLKELYPYIKRIYVCAEYPKISEEYKDYLLLRFEDTYYPEKILGAGQYSYVERNCEMINKSDFCVLYYIQEYKPPKRKNNKRELFGYQPKSGTHLAYEYARKKNKIIINLTDTCL